MQPNQQSLTIQKLNQGYIRLIKLFLDGKVSNHTNRLEQFLTNPSPAQSYSLLQKIHQQNSRGRIQSENNSVQSSHKNHQSPPQNYQVAFKKAISTPDDHKRTDYGSKTDSNNAWQSNSENKPKNIYYGNTQVQKGRSKESKVQSLRRITGKLTQVFSENQKKVQRYNQLAKQSGNNSNQQYNQSEGRHARPVEIGFKKY